MAKHLNKVIDIENNTLAILHIEDMFVILQCVFHGIRLLRLRRIGCRETTNFFCPHRVHFFYSLTCSNFLPLPGFFFSIPSPGSDFCPLPGSFFLFPHRVLIFLPLPGSKRHDLQLIMQKLLAMAVSTVMTKLMIVFHVSFFIALKF